MLMDAKLMGIIPTANKVRAKEFYCGTLGLEFVADDGFAMVVRVSNALIRITSVGAFTPLPFTLLGWEVAAMEDEVRGLEAAGVAMERFSFLEHDELGIWTAPDGAKVAWFKDLDGNLLSVSQAR